MDNRQDDKTISFMRKRIDSYRKMIDSGETIQQRSLYQKMMDKEVERLNNYMRQNGREEVQQNTRQNSSQIIQPDRQPVSKPNAETDGMNSQPTEAISHAQQEPEAEVIRVQQKTFTADELAFFNGSGGKPAYVAINGLVYDVSNDQDWGGGTHFGLYAGRDLSAQFMQCHSDHMQVLTLLPQIGTMEVG